MAYKKSESKSFYICLNSENHEKIDGMFAMQHVCNNILRMKNSQ